MGILDKNNPANKSGKTTAERKRIPMSVPMQKLEVPQIDGYVQYWFRNEPGRIQRALNAGYEFVRDDEVGLNSVGLGNDSAASGNSDMGSNVSVISGAREDGQAERLILMKIRQDLHDEDMAAIEVKNAQVAASLRGDFLNGNMGTDGAPGDTSHRYVDKSKSSTNLFTPKR